MALSSPDFVTKHQLAGESDGSHTTDLGAILATFDTIHHVLWDDSGFITSSKARQGIKRKEDAVIRLGIIGRISTDTYIAQVEIVYSLPYGKYKRFEDIPVSEWNTQRTGLETYLVTTQSLAVIDGKIL